MGQREQNRESKREALVEAGLNRLLTRPMDLLRSALNASTLSTDCDMPKDTAYRQFREAGLTTRDAIVREVAAAATRPSWSGFSQSADQIADAFQQAIVAERPYDSALIESMAANVDAQFSSPGGPVGWIFHAAAITASPAWQGGGELAEDDRKLAEELLEIRSRFYREMSDVLLPILIAAMSLVGRRPRRGLDPHQILAILHAMVDGAVLRRYIEPDAFDSALVGEAMYALANWFTENGALADPRRPQTPEGDAVFDRLVLAASSSWREASDRTVETTAIEAGVPTEAALLMFPTIADLADSVIWTRVLGAGSVASAMEPDENGRVAQGAELAMMLGLLRRLRDAVEALGGAVAVVQTQRPEVGIGVAIELEREVAEVLRTHCSGVNPRVTAKELVTSAFAGNAGWSTVSALMRVLDSRPDPEAV